MVKSGPRRLFVPNSAFLTREFMVVDDTDGRSRPRRDLGNYDGLADEALGPLSGSDAPSARPIWAQEGGQRPGGTGRCAAAASVPLWLACRRCCLAARGIGSGSCH